MDDILSNLKFIKHRIKLACNKSGRDMSSVQLLLATKTVPAGKIKIALNSGEKLIGENKSQELRDKFEELKLIPHQTHFIGHLQSNKIKEVLKYAQCIQSIDRIDLVQKLDWRLQQEGSTLDIMLQVNTSFEESKFGIDPANALEFARKLLHLIL